MGPISASCSKLSFGSGQAKTVLIRICNAHQTHNKVHKVPGKYFLQDIPYGLKLVSKTILLQGKLTTRVSLLVLVGLKTELKIVF